MNELEILFLEMENHPYFYIKYHTTNNFIVFCFGNEKCNISLYIPEDENGKVSARFLQKWVTPGGNKKKRIAELNDPENISSEDIRKFYVEAEKIIEEKYRLHRIFENKKQE
jgi:hypothetical protein